MTVALLSSKTYQQHYNDGYDCVVSCTCLLSSGDPVVVNLGSNLWNLATVKPGHIAEDGTVLHQITAEQAVRFLEPKVLAEANRLAELDRVAVANPSTIQRGDTVVTVKPYNPRNKSKQAVPVGLHGRVFWVGTDDYSGGKRLGVEFTNGDKAFIGADKCAQDRQPRLAREFLTQAAKSECAKYDLAAAALGSVEALVLHIESKIHGSEAPQQAPRSTFTPHTAESKADYEEWRHTTKKGILSQFVESQEELDQIIDQGI